MLMMVPSTGTTPITGVSAAQPTSFQSSTVSSATNVVASDLSSGISGLVSRIFGGGTRDAQRQQRANWMQQAAVQGSVIAARLILAAPSQVAADEKPYWQTAATAVQAQAPTVWNQAVALGAQWADAIDRAANDFNMTDTKRQIVAELQALGKAPPVQPANSTPQASAFQQAIGAVVNQAGASLSGQAANAIAPGSGFVSIPTSTNTLILVGALALGAFLLIKHAD